MDRAKNSIPLISLFLLVGMVTRARGQPYYSDALLEGMDMTESGMRLKIVEVLLHQRARTIEHLVKIAQSEPDKPLEDGDPRIDAIRLLGEYRTDNNDVILDFLIRNVELIPIGVRNPTIDQYPCVAALIKIGKPAARRAAIRLAQLSSTEEMNIQLKKDLLIYVVQQIEGEDVGEAIIEEEAPIVGGDSKMIASLIQRASERRLRLMRSELGIQIRCLGPISTKNIAEIVAEEFTRVRTVIHLSYTTMQADIASVGAFVSSSDSSDENRMWLLLGERPKERAMEVYGQKWNELQPAEHLFGGRATAIIVNATNKLDSLTLGQVQAIFSGDVTDWAVIGSTGLTPAPGSRTSVIPINCFGLQANEPAAGVFHKEGLPPSKFKRVVLKKDTAEAVAAVSMDPQAIAFVDLAAIPATGQTVKVLSIQVGTGDRARIVSPTPENIRNAMYPLSQRLYLYVHPKASDTAKDFATFIATCGGSEATPYADTVKAMMDTFRGHGLIPLADAALERMAKDEAAAAAAILQTEATKPRGK